MNYFNDNKTTTNCYIGKPTNGNFITTRSGATTITLSGLPVGLLSITDKDIEAIRQMDNAGHVIKVFNRINNKITVATNVITVEGASFAVTDVLVVYTNIPATAADVDVTTSSITSDCYIGKTSGTNGGDFLVTYTAATQVTLSAFPGAITAIYNGDIESIRQIDTSGAVVAEYHRNDTTMSMSGAVLTVTGAAFVNTDTIIIFTNIPRPASSGAGGAGGGSIVYTNMSGDFVATITNGTTNITITGLPFTLEAGHVVLGSIKKKVVTTNVITTLLPSTVSVSGGVITLGGVTNFATGDEVYISLIGPDKAYDISLDSQQVVVQNPDYGHYTGVETLISETNLLGYKATGDAGGDTDDIVDADGAFAISTHAVGYTAWQTADNQSALITAVDLATNISTATLSGSATWQSKAYSLPAVRRYEIPMEGYNFLTLHYRLSPTTNCNSYLKIYGTLDASATPDADTNWVDMSLEIFGNSAGIATAVGVVSEGIITIDTPTTMLKYMLKLVQESSVATAATNTYTVFIKKSS